MNNLLYIPKTIHAGYQNRTDTYTQKLAYVIYTDDKGKKRKETSWNSWRSKDIPTDDFANDPVEGFVLNRGVGGQRYSYGWNARNEYVRVYDPRNFEIEISVSNLLFILQECTSTKGKGLEGKFVYSWSGTELILLPVDCQEYKDSVNYTGLQSQKVTRKDMQPGYIYTFKDNKSYVYLGRRDSRESSSRLNMYNPEGKLNKAHIFHPLGEEDEYSWRGSLKGLPIYRVEKGFTKIATKGEMSPDYADYLDAYSKSPYSNEYVYTTKVLTNEEQEKVINYLTTEPEEQKGYYYRNEHVSFYHPATNEVIQFHAYTHNISDTPEYTWKPEKVAITDDQGRVKSFQYCGWSTGYQHNRTRKCNIDEIRTMLKQCHHLYLITLKGYKEDVIDNSRLENFYEEK